MSDESPDVSKIAPPAETPPDKPDPQTRAENEEYRKKKSPSPTDRMVAEHQDHISTFREQINHHKEECARLRSENAAERERAEGLLAVERKKTERLGHECVKLRELSWAGGWMSLIGNGMVALGGVGLGIAGCWPELRNEMKYTLGGGGSAGAICGVAVTVLAFITGRRARKPTD